MVGRFGIALILCASFALCAAIPETPLAEGASDVEVLLQEEAHAHTAVAAALGGDEKKQLGAPIHPRKDKTTCFEVELPTGKNAPGKSLKKGPGALPLRLAKCVANAMNQLWFYDRLGGGLLSASNGKYCLTRDGKKISAEKCGGDEKKVKQQQWQFMCGAWVNGDKMKGRVLSRVPEFPTEASPWTGSPDQLWEFAEVVHHSKCENKQYKTLDFDGTSSTTGKIPALISMPEKDFTIAMWVNGESGTPFSYSTKNTPKAVVISNLPSIVVHVLDTKVETKVNAAKKGWVHLSLTWETKTGKVTLFVNGQPAFNKTLTDLKGKKLTAGGCLMLGQEQKSECKKVNEKASFKGSLSDLMIWDTAYDPGTIQQLMIEPVHPQVMKGVGRLTAPKPPTNLRLAYLSRQYAKEELVQFPPVCPLDIYKAKVVAPMSDKPAGKMTYSGSGDVHYRNFAGCCYDDQSVGEWVAVRVKEAHWQQAPLMIQYRTSPHKTKCAWCQNGAVAYIDGCAVKYHEDQASAGFGGFDASSKYEPFSAMNGKPHKGWKWSPNKRMRVNFGKGGSWKRHFEAQVSDGTYIKCSPRSIYITLPKKYTGKIHGMGGTGVKGRDWEAGPNTEACPKCTYKRQVAGTNGICHNHYVYTKPADPFNGNAISKPIVQMFRSWQVDGKVIPSVFYYSGKHSAGSFNRNAGEKIKPPVETKKESKEDKAANEACKEFRNAPNMRSKCFFDFKMMGPEAVKQSKRDRERQREGMVKKPDRRSIRDVSRYRNTAEWTGKTSWGCVDDLDKTKEAQMEGMQSKRAKMMEAVVPVEAKYVMVYLDQAQTRKAGLSTDPQGILSFSEVKVFGSGDKLLNPVDFKLSSIQFPQANHTAKMCMDNKIETDCCTAAGKISKMTFTLSTKQVIQRVVLQDSRSAGSHLTKRNIGAVVILADSTNVVDPFKILSWQSPMIKKHKPQYEFIPRTEYVKTKMTQNARDSLKLWRPNMPNALFTTGSLVLPPGGNMLSYRKFSSKSYLRFSGRFKAKGPGLIKIDTFVKKCRKKQKKGIGLTLSMKDNQVQFRQNTLKLKVFNTTADITEWHDIMFELNNNVFKTFINNKEVNKQFRFKKMRKKGKICLTAMGESVEVKDVQIRELKPIGRIAVARELRQKSTVKRVSKRKIRKYRKLYKTEKKGKALIAREIKQKKAVIASEKEEKGVAAAKLLARTREKRSKENAVKCDKHTKKEKIYNVAENKAKRIGKKTAKLYSLVNATTVQIDQEEKEVIQMGKNMVKSKKTIANAASSLATARTASSVAYTQEMQSYRQHKATAKSKDDLGEDKEEKDGADKEEKEEVDYGEKAMQLKQVHAQQLEAIAMLHDSQRRKNELIRSLRKLKADLISQTAEAHTEAAMLATADKKKDKLKKELDAKAQRNKDMYAKKAKQDKANQVKKLSVFDTNLNGLKNEPDEDIAFDKEEQMSKDAPKGLSIKLTGRAAALEQLQSEEEQTRLQKIADSLNHLKKGSKDPKIIKLEKALEAARATKDPAKILAAEKALKDALNKPPSDSASKQDLKTLRKALAAAKAKGDQTRVAVLMKFITTAEDALDPTSPQGRVVALKRLLAKAQKDCFYNKDDPKSKQLLKTLKAAQKDAKAEENGKEEMNKIKNAMGSKPKKGKKGDKEGKKGDKGDKKGKKKKADPKKPLGPKERAAALKGGSLQKKEPNKKINQVSLQIAAAKKKNDTKKVASLEKRLVNLKERDVAKKPKKL